MFACLYSLSAPVRALVEIAQGYTPRYEIIGPLVMLDVSGLTRLFGSAQEIGEHLRRATQGQAVRIALAPTQTAAALLALGRPGLTVVMSDAVAVALAPLPVRLLEDLERLRQAAGPAPGPPAPVATIRTATTSAPTASALSAATVVARVPRAAAPGPQPTPPQVGAMWDALPAFESMLDRTTDAVVRAHTGCGGGGGWRHPRNAHAAATLRPRRSVTASQGTEHPHAAPAPGSGTGRGTAESRRMRTIVRTPAGTATSPTTPPVTVPSMASSAVTVRSTTCQALAGWGIKTFAALAALPPGAVYERLGARGVLWQRLARGEDTNPMVPWVPEDPFEAALDLEWPIEGLEPLSFVLGRLLDPLADRLERADRGAVIIHTHLRLVSKEVHARTLQLPAPMRDSKVLRTLVLLDLESNPPTAAIDQVRVLVEPTRARVLQWTLFERAQPSPEQVTTLLARLGALMGDSHVGSPRLADSWKPGAFEMTRFEIPSAPPPPDTGRLSETPPASALRRFRLPVPARVQVQDGRPVRVMTDRKGVGGGAIVQAAGPWRTSGAWWNDEALESHPSDSPHPSHPPPSAWDRDEWDIAVADGTIYRLYIEREIGQWFIEGVVD